MEDFSLILTIRVISVLDKLIRLEYIKMFAQNNSIIKRNRSKAVELLSRVSDYVEHKFQKGFTYLTLNGQKDTVSFCFPLTCFLLESRRILSGSLSKTDHRINNHKARCQRKMLL